MSKISITFDGLDGDQAAALIELYGQVMAGQQSGMTVRGVVASAEPAPTPGVPAVIGAAVNDALALRNGPPLPPAHTSAPPAPASFAGAVAAGTLDGEGVPYNPTFHAPSGRHTASGGWALKKGVDKDGAAQWRNAHKGRAATAAPPPPPPAMAPPPPPPLASPTPPRAVSYEEFRSLYSSLVSAGKLDADDVNAVMKELGETDLGVFVNDADKRSSAYVLLSAFD